MVVRTLKGRETGKEWRKKKLVGRVLSPYTKLIILGLHGGVWRVDRLKNGPRGWTGEGSSSSHDADWLRVATESS